MALPELRGRVAVVTGGASGIGFALGRRFVEEGMRVVLADVEEPPLERAVAELNASGGTVLGVPTDVSSVEQVQRLAETAMREFGAVHLVCNNAGVETGAPFLDIPAAAWRWVMDVNFGGVLNGCRVFLPILLEQGEGHIVNTASTAAFATGLPTFTPYSASKFAVHGLSENLEIELRSHGEAVGVSLLVPGITRTRMPDAERNLPSGLSRADGPERRRVLDFLARTAAERGLEPDAVAGLVVEAVREDRFFILTHPDQTLAALRTRLRWMETGERPGTRLPSAAVATDGD